MQANTDTDRLHAIAILQDRLNQLRTQWYALGSQRHTAVVTLEDAIMYLRSIHAPFTWDVIDITNNRHLGQVRANTERGAKIAAGRTITGYSRFCTVRLAAWRS